MLISPRFSTYCLLLACIAIVCLCAFRIDRSYVQDTDSSLAILSTLTSDGNVGFNGMGDPTITVNNLVYEWNRNAKGWTLVGSNPQAKNYQLADLPVKAGEAQQMVNTNPDVYWTSRLAQFVPGS